MGRGAIRGPVRGVPAFRGRGGGPPTRGAPFPNQRTPAIPQLRNSPAGNKETDQLKDKFENVKGLDEVEDTPNLQNDDQAEKDKCEIKEATLDKSNDDAIRGPAPVNEISKMEESIETSRVELEFPNTSSILAGDDLTV